MIHQTIEGMCRLIYSITFLHSSQALLVTCHAQNSYAPFAALGQGHITTSHFIY